MPNNLFSNILGQDKVKDFLNKAYSNQRLASALLFYGPCSVGKNLTAYALSQALLCIKPNLNNSFSQQACGLCQTCVEVKDKRSAFVLEIIAENKIITVEQVAQALSFLQLKTSSPRVIIVDQGQYLNIQSSNKLLKTLEELNKNNYIILLSPSVKSLLSTINSRLNKIAFARLDSKNFLSITKAETDKAFFFNCSIEDYKKWQNIVDTQTLEKNINFWSLFVSQSTTLSSFVSKNISKKVDIENLVYIGKKLLLNKIKSGSPAVLAFNKIFKPLSKQNCILLMDLLLILEKDIKANINPLLSLENFCITAME